MRVCRIPVRLGDRSYDVMIGSGHLGHLGRELRRLGIGTDPVVMSHPTLLKTHAREVAQLLTRDGFRVHPLAVPDTERSKSLKVLSQLLLRIADLDRPGRRLFLVLVSGGVVGDLGGLLAGIYRRGIPYVQVPTTLLAQVDSSIGGKTGVDLPQGKNLVGLFYQPKFVFIELKFLESLPLRQFRSGLAEIAKCGAIRDRTLFSFLERCSVEELRRNQRSLSWLVQRAVRVKASIVEEDEQETRGIRTILNLGHTLGHALEAATGYSRAYTHGEAIAIGMLVATEISYRLGLIRKVDADRMSGLIQHLGLPTSIRKVSLSHILLSMAHDKKWVQARNRWILPTGIGQCVVRSGVPEGIVQAAIRRALKG